ncbi:hypothetical protein C8R47DRAFT_1227221 [Mycena vitilis]|nr:hypothetical protein C8R47DRAFT_1227221 [Mycena vitilis]
MPCQPPYYPCPGHESIAEHDRCSGCMFYAVWAGFVRGNYTNSWLAREQTEHFTDSRQKGFKSITELRAWWTMMCNAHHGAGCPPFEPRTFSLHVSPVTHPSSQPCTRAVPAASSSAAAASSSAPTASSSAPAASSSAAVHVPAFPTAAPSPFNASSSSSTSTSSWRTTTTAASPTPKKEEPASPAMPRSPVPRVTPNTRIQLTPAGVARGNTLVSVAQRAEDAADRADAAIARLTGSVSLLATPTAAANAAMATVMVTPRPETASALAPGPRPPSPRADPPVRQYGIRGVAVFYSSFAAAKAAAKKLGLPDSKIMVSSNVDKLEAWMTGEPFLGED